jgi:hypothetical protein
MGTYDGQFISIYVNGKLGASLAYNGTNPPYPQNMKIGTATHFSGSWFNGSCDDIRIYNRALSSNEVAQLYSIEAGFLNIHKAVYLDTGGLIVGSNYQLQASSDLQNWTNQGAVFTATNAYWRPANYWDTENWNQLFFRLLPR